MRLLAALLLIVTVAVGGTASAAQLSAEDQRALRTRIQEHYEIVPLSDGVALRPKTRMQDVRLIEVSNGSVSINGEIVSGRELRDKIGEDADAVLRLSYLSPEEQRAVSQPEAEAAPPQRETQTPAERREGERRRAHGDRVRVFGNVVVGEDEEITGQVVAVLGSVKIDGEVGDQVVAVLGSVDLGPRAIVHGDVVSVGGHVRRAPGAQTQGGVTEISLANSDLGVHVGPWFDDWGPFAAFVGFGAFPRLVGTGFRLLLLLILTGLVFIIARPSVEASAQRVTDDPVKVTLVGLVAEVLALPVLVLIAILLAISIVGIPLLLLLPFAVLLLIVLALVGFTGTAAALGQWLQRRFGLASTAPFGSIVLGVLLILAPLLIGRLLALAGWPLTPFAVLFVGFGFALELLAWASGFGAMITNVFTRWRARRATA